MKKIISVFVLLFSTLISIKAQNTVQNDTLLFKDYSDKILIRVNMSTQTDEYSLNINGDRVLDVKANNSYKLFLTADYKFIGFSYGFSPSFFGGNKDDKLKGNSSFKDFNFRVFLSDHWLQTFQYSKVRGYYVDTRDFLSDMDDEMLYILFPDLKNVSYSMATSYIFNPKFSLKSITSFTEWQKHSAGTFMPNFRYGYEKSSFTNGNNKFSEDDIALRLGIGYYYNFILADKFYIAPNLMPSIGLRFSTDKSYENGQISKEKQTYYPKFLEGGLRMGYNSDRMYAGGSYNFNVNWYGSNTSGVTTNNQSYMLFYVGYRFGAPKWVANPVKDVENKLKL